MPTLANIKRWLFRLGRDEQLPIVLTQRRIFILPTRPGLLFALVLVVMLLGAINYSLSLGHALVFLLTGFGLAAMVHTFRNLVGLSMTPGRPEPVFAGDLARFPLYLANPRREPRRALELRFANGETTRADLAANGNTRVDIPLIAMRRGWLDPGRITLATRYPVGLFRAWSYPHPAYGCLVYPRPLERALPPPRPVATPGAARGESGQEDFAGLRPRTPSDPPRHIAWKAVARAHDAQPLPVKHFAGGSSEELWLDWNDTATEPDIETRLSILTGWVLAADAGHHTYGLMLPGHEIPLTHGNQHRDRCLEALAVFNPHSRPRSNQRP